MAAGPESAECSDGSGWSPCGTHGNLKAGGSEGVGWSSRASSVACAEDLQVGGAEEAEWSYGVGCGSCQSLTCRISGGLKAGGDQG